MNGEIGQLIAVVTYANAFLQGHEVGLDLNHTMTKFCQSVEFIEFSKDHTLENRVVISGTPNDWFDFLKALGTEKVRLHYNRTYQEELPDRIDLTFSGGEGRWIMETIQNETSTLWGVGWKTGKPRSNRLWNVFYYILATKWDPHDISMTGLAESREKLLSASFHIESFANKHKSIRHWATAFSKARSVFAINNPLGEYDYLPAGCLSNEAEQLIAASFQHFIFGRNSWSDYRTEGEVMNEHRRVSYALYEAICIAIEAGVNSYPERN